MIHAGLPAWRSGALQLPSNDPSPDELFHDPAVNGQLDRVPVGIANMCGSRHPQPRLKTRLKSAVINSRR